MACPAGLDVAGAVELSPVSRDPDELNYDGVGAVLRLGNGEVLVAGRRTPLITFFTTDGRVTHRVGRRGEGPGDFSDINALTRTRGDTISVWEFQVGAETLLTADGRFILRRAVSPELAARGLQVRARDSSGRWLVTKAPLRAPSPLKQYLQVDTLALRFLEPAGGGGKTIAEMIGSPRLIDRSRWESDMLLLNVPIPYAPRSGLVLAEDTLLFLSHGDRSVRLIHARGGEIGRLDANVSSGRVNPGAVRAFFDRYRSDVPERLLPWLEERLTDLPIPDTVPGHHAPGMQWDERRRWLWLQEREVVDVAFDTLRLRAIDGLGRSVTRIAVPRAVRVLNMFRDGVLVEGRADYDEQVVWWMPWEGC